MGFGPVKALRCLSTGHVYERSVPGRPVGCNPPAVDFFFSRFWPAKSFHFESPEEVITLFAGPLRDNIAMGVSFKVSEAFRWLESFFHFRAECVPYC